MGQEFFRFRANQTARPVSIGSGLTFTSEKEVDGMKEDWQGRNGYRALNSQLNGYPLLRKYLTGIQFFPSKWDGRWPEGENWIMFPSSSVSSFSKETMLKPFLKLLFDKATHYSRSGIGFDHLTLVIYYGQAVIYNSPAETADFKFEDFVRVARRFVTSI